MNTYGTEGAYEFNTLAARGQGTAFEIFLPRVLVDATEAAGEVRRARVSRLTLVVTPSRFRFDGRPGGESGTIVPVAPVNSILLSGPYATFRHDRSGSQDASGRGRTTECGPNTSYSARGANYFSKKVDKG
jgi:hypothetical protein